MCKLIRVFAGCLCVWRPMSLYVRARVLYWKVSNPWLLCLLISSENWFHCGSIYFIMNYWIWIEILLLITCFKRWNKVLEQDLTCTSEHFDKDLLCLFFYRTFDMLLLKKTALNDIIRNPVVRNCYLFTFQRELFFMHDTRILLCFSITGK